MSAAAPCYSMDGFDFYNATLGLRNWSAFGNNAEQISQITGRFGGGAFRLTSGGGSNGRAGVQKTADFAPGGITGGFSFGFAMRFNSMGGGVDRAQLQTTANNRVCSVGMNGSNQLYIGNAAGSSVATGTTALQSGIWYHIELIGNTVSTTANLTLYLNGIQEATASSVNIGSTAINRYDFECTAGNSGTVNEDVDDVYVIGAGSQHGDLRIETIRPHTAGTTAQWTPNASTNVSRVGDANDNLNNDGDTTYNQDSNPGDIDTFVPQQLSGTAGTVIAVQTNLVARKDDAGTRQIADVIRQGGTNYAGTTTGGLAASYLFYTQMHDQDPTATDWTVANVNGDEFGYKLVT